MKSSSLTSSRRVLHSKDLVRCLLEEPQLVAQIQSLEAPLLNRIIQHVGLEDSAELLAFTSSRQLRELFDLDLWKAGTPGQDERFDPTRFATWLEVLLELGSDFAAQKISEMDEDLIASAFAHHLVVLDSDQLDRQGGILSPELGERLIEGTLNQEFSDCLVMSRNDDSWDAVLSVLVALDAKHYEYLQAVLRNLASLSRNEVETEHGLYDLLNGADRLDQDVAYDREIRREELGFVSPRDAATFLAAARDDRGPDTEEKLQLMVRQAARVLERRRLSPRTPVATGASGLRLNQLLNEAGVLEEAAAPRFRLTGPAETKENAEPWSRLKERIHQDPQASNALAYVANVLEAGCELEGERMRALEAIDAAAATCNLGLEIDPTARDLIEAFRAGWSVLHREVSLHSARALHHWLTELEERGLPDLWRSLRPKLARLIERSDPYALRGDLDILQVLLPAEDVKRLQSAFSRCPCFWKSGTQKFFASRGDIERHQTEVARTFAHSS